MLSAKEALHLTIDKQTTGCPSVEPKIKDAIQNHRSYCICNNISIAELEVLKKAGYRVTFLTDACNYLVEWGT